MTKRSAAFALLLCLTALPARAETNSVAASVKAAYLVKFPHYVTWPAGAFGAPTAPLVLCIVGHDPFGTVIDAMARDERVDRHPLVIRRMATIDRGTGCHIAYVDGVQAERELAAIEHAPVFSVTDSADTQPRGVLAFEQRGGHVGFGIDDQMAARSGLTISSRLLSIAWSVISRGGMR